MAELIRTYADLPLGAVDASVIAVAERLKLTDVATLANQPRCEASLIGEGGL